MSTYSTSSYYEQAPVYTESRQVSVAAAAAPVLNYQSNVEQQVINARQPIQFHERETVQAGQFRGIHLNRSEEQQFRGPVSISQYKINDDSNPEVIRKRLEAVKYVQECAVRYLNPPVLPKPGDLIIKERQGQVPAAPPVVLRVDAPRPTTPAPLVLRERPPRVPAAVPQQVIEVEGTPVPPPARRVVVEKLASNPAKPQNVVIERWLPFRAQKRRVVFHPARGQAPANPRNLIIEWETPEAQVEKVTKDLGVQDANPEEYVRRYGAELKDASELARYACSQSSTRQLAAQVEVSAVPELEGDVQALRLVDLDRHGLAAYRSFVSRH